MLQKYINTTFMRLHMSNQMACLIKLFHAAIITAPT